MICYNTKDISKKYAASSPILHIQWVGVKIIFSVVFQYTVTLGETVILTFYNLKNAWKVALIDKKILTLAQNGHCQKKV